MAYRPLPNPLPRGEGIDWQAVPILAATSKGLSFCVLTLFFTRKGMSSPLILQAYRPNISLRLIALSLTLSRGERG